MRTARCDWTNEIQIRSFETKLMTDAYKNIEEKHRRKMIEHRTTEMAVTDLDKYWTALDKVIYAIIVDRWLLLLMLLCVPCVYLSLLLVLSLW